MARYFQQYIFARKIDQYKGNGEMNVHLYSFYQFRFLPRAEHTLCPYGYIDMKSR